MKHPDLINRFAQLKFAILALGFFCCLPLAALAGPALSGLHAATDIYDNQTSQLFHNATVTDAEGAEVTVTITITPAGYGNFAPASGLETAAGSATVLQCSAAEAATLLRSLVFIPALNKIPVAGSQSITFSVQATDTNGASSAADSSTTLVVNGPERPVVGNAGATGNINDKQTWSPFSSVTIRDDYPSAVTVTIVASPAGYGAFQSVSGLQVSGNVSTITQRTPAQAQALIRSLVFDPQENHIPIGSSQNVTFKVWASDTNGLCSTTNSSTVLTINPVNDAPVLSGVGAVSTTDKAIASPFSNVVISEVDNDGSQTVTVEITYDTAKGTLLLNSSGFSGSAGNYSFTGTAANAQAAMRLLTFDPVENHIPPGQSETATFNITVTDASGASDSDAASVTINSINDAPILSGLSSTRQSVATGRSITPFAGAMLTDLDANTDTNRVGQSQTITVTMSGSLGNAQLQSGGFSGVVFTQSGLTPTDATTVLRSLIFAAQTYPLTTTNTISFTVIVRDESGASSTNTSVSVDVSTPFVPPGLSGTRSDQRVNDNSTIALFSTVNVQSYNGGFFQVAVRLDDDAKGSLINLGGFVKSGSPAVYTFVGPCEDATTSLREMLFQPVSNRLNGSSNETVTFSLTLVDQTVTNAPDSTTTVIVTPVNDAPTIQGISPLVTITDTEQRAPFPTILIGDVDELAQQVLSVTLRLDDTAKGGFDPASLADSGFVNAGGVYTYSGVPSAVSTALRKLVFVPTPRRLPVGLSDITTFNLAISDNHGGQVSNSSTQIRVAAVNGAPVISVPPGPISLPLAPPINPLSTVSFSTPQMIEVTVRLTNLSCGTFTATSLAANHFSSNALGSWSFTGAASNATVAVAGLEFVPDSHLPVGTVIAFLISARDQVGNVGQAELLLVLRQDQRSIIVTKTSDFDPSDASVTASQRNGTLRQALIDAGNNDHITFDIRSQVAGVPDYPATIRLRSSLVLNKNVTFDGPGADALTISGDTDGDGVGDVQIIQANARVVVNRLTLANGFHPTAGGGIEASPGSFLSLRDCAIVNCRAGVWGGGIDVNLGSLEVNRCLIRGNSTTASTGQGGGGIAIYSSSPARIANTTFSSNQQLSPAGLGGGALYVENADAGVEMDVAVACCTFAGNRDAAGHGSAVRPNVFNSVVWLQNTILADGQGKNLEMDESGMILSLGGNISDDATSTVFSIGGASFDTVVLDQLTDVIQTNASLLTLAGNGGPTWTYGLGTSSLARGMAVSNAPTAPSFHALATDQRGYIRDNAPDTGAFEAEANTRVIIEEIQCNPVAPNDEFIEFFVPHDSATLNMADYQVWVGNTLRHTFSSQALRPGEALVLFSHLATGTNVPSGVYRQIAAGNLLLDNMADTITLKNPAGQIVLEINYVNSFSCSDPADPGYLTVPNQSLVLSPQFQGVYLPYQRVVQKEGGRTPGPGDLSGAGYDAAGLPLMIGNAPPSAYNDLAATDALTPVSIPVLANDFDPDATDLIRVVAVGTNGALNAAGLSVCQATLLIEDSPRTGASISYSPANSALLRSLPQGSNVVDTFQYVIIDSTNGVDHSRGATPGEIASNLAKATATVSVRVTGVNQAPTPADDDVLSTPRLTVAENAILDFTTADTILGNDTDPNTDDSSTTLNMVSVQATNGCAGTLQATSLLGASVSLDIRYNRNETHITYDPRGSGLLNAIPAGQSLVDTFFYSVADRHGAIGTAAIRITVTGVNDGPVATPDIAATDEDTPITLSASQLLANDIDADDNAVLQITSADATSARGALVSVVAGNVFYDPTVSGELNALARSETVQDSFTYFIGDGLGGTSSALVTLTITGVNDAPWSTNDLYSTGENTPFEIPAAGVLANDADPDINGALPDDSLRVLPFAEQTTAAGARAGAQADGRLTYDPLHVFDWLAQGWTTNDTFTYTVIDHSLTIANADLFTVQGGSASNSLPVLVNDACLSAAGGVLTITSVTSPSKGGTVVLAGSTNLCYSPPQNFSGVETFSYSIADGLGGSDSATVSVTVAGATLTANPDWFTVAKGSTVQLTVLANDTVLPVGPTLSIESLSAGDKGGIILASGSGANSSVSYTPALGQTCPFTETFTYVTAAGGQKSTGVVSVTVIDRSNSLPANDDSFTVAAGGGTTALDVLANDQIIPGANTNLTIASIQTNGVMGTVSINAARNRLLYRPAPGVVQEPLIYYTIADGVGGTAIANVQIRVQTNGLAANGDVFAVMKDSTNNALLVLVNDAVFPTANLVITDIGLAANAPNRQGTVLINPAGNALTYTPAPGFVGEETFAYEIGDGSIARGQAFVRVKVLDVGSIVSNPDAFAVARDSANNVLNVLSNDYVLPRTPGRLVVAGILTNGAHGSIELSGGAANDSLAYTPPAGFIGLDTFSYVVADDFGNVSTNSVAVTVGELLTRPDRFTVLSESAQNALDVLVNDFFLPDAAAVRAIAALGIPDHGGLITTNPAGTRLLYTPAVGFVGTEQFTYQIADDVGRLVNATAQVNVLLAGSDRKTNTVTITIIGTNDLPLIAGTESWQITDKTTVQPFSNVVISDVDENGAQLQTVTVELDDPVKGVLTNLGGFSNPDPGIYVMVGSPADVTAALRDLVFVPTENRITVPTSEISRFTISVDDGFVSSPISDSTTTVEVRAINDPSTIAGTQAGFAITDKTTVQPFATVTIADVDDLQIQPLMLTVTLDNPDKGTLASLGLFTNAAPGVYTASGVASNLTAALRNLVFVPTENRITVPTNELIMFTIAVDDGFVPAPVTDSITSVNVTAVNDAPTVSGAGPSSINDQQTVRPFANVTIGEVDDLALQPLTLTITLDSALKGALQNLGGFTNLSDAVYFMRGTAAELTASIRALVYVPVENRITVTTPEPAVFAIVVDDSFAAPVTNSDTVVTVSAVNDSPVIAGTLSGQSVYSGRSIRPFQAVSITDIDESGQQPLAITVTLDQPSHGYLTNLAGFVLQSAGVYLLTPATPAQATAALRGLIFVPGSTRLTPGASETTRFTISVTDTGSASVQDSNTTVISIDSFIEKLSAANGHATNGFFYSVATTRDLALAGSPTDNGNYTRSGSACLYLRTNASPEDWTVLKRLVSPDVGTLFNQYDLFGYAVDLEGDTAVVGAPGAYQYNIQSGVVYIFGKDQGGTNRWGQVKKVLPPDGVNNDLFGCAVAISGDTLVVGARASKSGGIKSGSAYVFARNQGGTNQWGFVKKLTPADGGEGDDFGVSVAIDGDTIAVGARYHQPQKSGAVYLYDRDFTGTNLWLQSRKVVASELATNAAFGQAVSLHRGLLVAGAPSDTVNSVKSGSAFVFARDQGGSNQWGQIKKLAPADGATNDAFGFSVAVDAGTVAVGAPRARGGSGTAAAVYVFAKECSGLDEWSLLQKITPAPSDKCDFFGHAVSLNANTLATGGRYLDALNRQSNLTYIYRLRFGNAPYVLEPSVHQPFVPGVPVSYTIPAGGFVDVDGDSISISLGSSLPDWLTYDSATGTFSGTPAVSGTYRVIVIATDAEGFSSAMEVIFSTAFVSVALQNNAPAIVISGSPGSSYLVQRTLRLQGSSTVWEDVGMATASASGKVVLLDQVKGPSAFYRVKLR